MVQTKLTLTRTVLILAWLTMQSACSSVPRIISEYRIDIQQGNVVTQEMVAQLRPGLTKDQVRFVLGTPMLLDPFHDDRWDYVFLLKKGNTGEVENSKLSVYFDKNGLLEQFVNDVTLKETSPLEEKPAPEAKEQTAESTEQSPESAEQSSETQTTEPSIASGESEAAEVPTPAHESTVSTDESTVTAEESTVTTDESTVTAEEDATAASQNNAEGMDNDSSAPDKPRETASNGSSRGESSKIKVIDLGSIDDSTYQPPPDQEEQGLWGRMMDSIGF